MNSVREGQRIVGLPLAAWLGSGVFFSLLFLQYARYGSDARRSLWRAWGWANFAGVISALMSTGLVIQAFRWSVEDEEADNPLFTWLAYSADPLEVQIDAFRQWEELAWTPMLLWLLPLFSLLIVASPPLTQFLQRWWPAYRASQEIHRLTLALVVSLGSIPLFALVGNLDVTGIYSLLPPVTDDLFDALACFLILLLFFLWLLLLAVIGVRKGQVKKESTKEAVKS